MKKHLWLVAIGAAIVGSAFSYSPLKAAVAGSIWNSVAVCDPNAPNFCQTFAGTAPVSGQATCDTTGTVKVLDAATATPAGRIVSNISGATIYVGPSGVSSTTGFPVPTGTTLDLSKSTAAMYCATAADTAVMNSLQY
jgi:hypothetical protein